MFHPIYSFEHYAHFTCAWAGSAQKITAALAANDTNAPMALRVFWDALGTIERLEPALDALFAKDAVIEKRAQGLGWPEGPLWMPGLPPRCLLKLEGEGINPPRAG